MSRPRAVVIGVGNEYRRDDGIGPAVVRYLQKLCLPGVSVELCDGEATDLLDVWAGAELAVVVDAVLCEPSTPGRIWRTTVDTLRERTHATSSHALGIPDALPLGRVLNRVPAELVVIAVEAQRLDLGIGLSGPVAAARPEVVAAVLAELARLDIAPAPTH
ncbi:hydrogenase maturation protease [Nocardia niigatensis]|uniref:hydrogenase maturation protease n=1 Tax=Nocardia niigatensis TaxID=209249 RepID=UPI0005945128|nr:hydrogenase maturation protease [Nocardia niigatensis]